MKIYARIDAGTVAELFQTAGDISEMFHPDLVWVDVTAVNPAPMQGWTALQQNGAWTFTAPAVVPLTPAQQAEAAIEVGCQIVSTGSPDLNGTYPCDATAQSKIQATALYIQVNGKFPAGRATLPWADSSGVVHTFKTTAEFLAFATAVGDRVTELEMVILGESAALPAQPVTIA